MRNEGVHVRTDAEIIQTIDEAIKSIWENETLNDCKNKWLLQEDMLKMQL